MNVWILRFRSLFTPARVAPLDPVLLSRHSVPAASPRSGAPPITDLDLLRALGCDV